MTKAYAFYLAATAALLVAGASWMFGITFADLAAAPDSIYLGLQKAWLHSEDVNFTIRAVIITIYFGMFGTSLFMIFGVNWLSMASGFVFGALSWFLLLGPLSLMEDFTHVTPGQQTVFVLMLTLWVYVLLAGFGRVFFGPGTTFSNKTYSTLIPN